MKGQKIDYTNYHKHTQCVFKELTKKQQQHVNNNKPDYVSDSGSEYWHIDSGVIRFSNHFGNVASCKWVLNNFDDLGYVDIGSCAEYRINKFGFCKLKDFKKIDYCNEKSFVDVNKYLLKCASLKELKIQISNFIKKGKKNSPLFDEINVNLLNCFFN